LTPVPEVQLSVSAAIMLIADRAKDYTSDTDVSHPTPTSE